MKRNQMIIVLLLAFWCVSCASQKTVVRNEVHRKRANRYDQDEADFQRRSQALLKAFGIKPKKSGFALRTEDYRKILVRAPHSGWYGSIAAIAYRKIKKILKKCKKAVCPPRMISLWGLYRILYDMQVYKDTNPRSHVVGFYVHATLSIIIPILEGENVCAIRSLGNVVFGRFKNYIPKISQRYNAYFQRYVKGPGCYATATKK